jgi:hypothetical protein
MVLNRAHQALPHKARYAVNRVEVHSAHGMANTLHSVQRSTIAEDRQASEQGLFGRAEQRITPGDSGPQRLLSVGEVARATRQQVEATHEPGQERGGRQDVGSPRRKLDRQRQPIDSTADLSNRGGIVRGQHEVRTHRPRPFDEQGRSRRGADRGGGGHGVRVGHGKRRERVEPLATDAQRRPARR